MPASPLLLTDEELSTPKLRERFLRFVKVDEATGCHYWTGFISDLGYGRFTLYSPRRQRTAHRVAYRLFVGPIAPDMQVDHQCHTNDPTCNRGNDCMHRRCVNPAHLTQMTARENTLAGNAPAALCAKKTHCDRGHPLSGPESDVYVFRNGRGRQCRPCKVISRREYEERIAAGLVERKGTPGRPKYSTRSDQRLTRTTRKLTGGETR